MYCSKCGNLLKKEDNFCSICGTPNHAEAKRASQGISGYGPIRDDEPIQLDDFFKSDEKTERTLEKMDRELEEIKARATENLMRRKNGDASARRAARLARKAGMGKEDKQSYEFNSELTFNDKVFQVSIEREAAREALTGRRGQLRDKEEKEEAQADDRTGQDFDQPSKLPRQGSPAAAGEPEPKPAAAPLPQRQSAKQKKHHLFRDDTVEIPNIFDEIAQSMEKSKIQERESAASAASAASEAGRGRQPYRQPAGEDWTEGVFPLPPKDDPAEGIFPLPSKGGAAKSEFSSAAKGSSSKGGFGFASKDYRAKGGSSYTAKDDFTEGIFPLPPKDDFTEGVFPLPPKGDLAKDRRSFSAKDDDFTEGIFPLPPKDKRTKGGYAHTANDDFTEGVFPLPPKDKRTEGSYTHTANDDFTEGVFPLPPKDKRTEGGYTHTANDDFTEGIFPLPPKDKRTEGGYTHTANDDFTEGIFPLPPKDKRTRGGYAHAANDDFTEGVFPLPKQSPSADARPDQLDREQESHDAIDAMTGTSTPRAWETEGNTEEGQASPYALRRSSRTQPVREAEEGDEQEYEYFRYRSKKKKGPNAALVVVAVLVVIVAAVGAKMLYDGQTPASVLRQLKGVFTAAAESGSRPAVQTDKPSNAAVTGEGGDTQTQQTDEPRIDQLKTEGAADPAKMLRYVLSKGINKNIREILYNPDLKYQEAARSSTDDIISSTPVTDEVLYEKGGETYYCTEVIMSTMVQYNSQWIDYFNNKDKAVLSLLAKGSKVYKSAVNISPDGAQEEFVRFEIGEIRKGKDGYYVWTRETYNIVKENNSNTQESQWIYYLEPSGEGMKIVNYFNN